MLGMSFTLYQVWLYMAVFSAAETFRNDGELAPFAPLTEGSHAALVYVFLAASAATLLAFGLLRAKTLPFFESRKSVAIAGALGVAGTLMLQLGAGDNVAGVACAATCMGICAGIFVLLLGNAFARFEFATCVLDSAVSVALGFICAVAFVNWIPAPASGFIAALMPVFMAAAFWKKQHAEPGSPEAGIDSTYLLAYLRQFATSMALFGIVVGALRVVCADRMLSSGEIATELVLGGSCIAGVLLFVVAIAASKRETLWDSLFRTVTPVVSLGIACTAVLAGSMQLGAAFFAALGFVSLAALLWVFLASLARSLNGAAIFVFGIGYGLMQATSMVGCILANTLLGTDGMGAAVLEAVFAAQGTTPADSLQTAGGPALLALTLCAVLAFANAVSPRYREIRGIFSSALSKMLLANEAVAGDEGASVEDASREAATDVEPSQDEPQAAKPTEEAVEPVPLAAEAAEAESQEDRTRPDKGSFVRRCDELSSEFGLSAREREVFFLLAKGHNAAFITDKLCVSRSTAKTHINHIYKKMDIHTQQQLLTMVEDRDRGPLGADIDRDALREALRKANEEGSLERNPSGQVSRDYIGF